MKKLILLIFPVISSLNILISQNKNIEKNFSVKKMYQIHFDGLPRTLELVEMPNGEFEGHFKIKLDRENKNITQKIQREVPMTKNDAKELMLMLENMGIETIASCEENNDCKEFLDADFTTFKINTPKNKRQYSFYNLSDLDLKNEKPENRRQAQQILNYIDKRLDFKIEYQKIKKEHQVADIATLAETLFIVLK